MVSGLNSDTRKEEIGMPVYWFEVGVAFGAWMVTYLLTPVMERLAWRAGAVDRPRGRHTHARPTALWGGVAIFVGFGAATLIGLAISPEYGLSRPIAGILLGATLIAVLGIVDDLRELRAGPQILGQLLGVGVLIYFGAKIEFVTNPFTRQMVPLGAWGDLLTVVWVLGMINTINWIDGLDGVAGGVSAITAATLGLMAVQMHQVPAAILAAAVCGAAVGFLRYNLFDHKVKVFMGSVGAQVLGFVLASISIIGALKVPATIAVAVPVLVFGVPLFDGVFVLARRLAHGQPLHEGSRVHLHHRLLERGFKKHQVVLVIYGLTLIFCTLAFCLFRMAQ